MNKGLVIESAEYIKSKISTIPKIGLILGSGLGKIGDTLEDAVYIDYKDVPNMPSSTVQGHKGRFVVGKLGGRDVIVMQGRFHFYEGNDPKLIALPILIFKLLGVENLIITNAAGGVNTSFNPGDLMLIKDHINLSGCNPLIGENDEFFGTRFPDMSCVYNKDLLKVAIDAAKTLSIDIKEGSYLMMSGPNYETPAEVKMIRILGGDAVGMSTVPESMVAAYCGIAVLGISCITNMACGILDAPLNHLEVIETSKKVEVNFINLIQRIIKNI